MRIWGIADLHLSGAVPGSQEQHAARWRDHTARIAEAWSRAVDPGDLVLIPGDISMAQNHRQLQPDLNWLERLPGRKVLAPGNHDRWWNSLERIRPMLRPGQLAVEGTAIEVDGVIVCGARGCSAEPDGSAELQARQLQLLDDALVQAEAMRGPGQPLYVLWHYPPHDRRGHPGPVVDRLVHANATCCVFGHLHQLGQWTSLVQGVRNGVKYACVAADAVGFRPIRLDAPPVTLRR